MTSRIHSLLLSMMLVLAVVVTGSGGVLALELGQPISNELEATIEVQPVYTIGVTVAPAGAGTVTGAGDYAHGATVELVAAPATGYNFVNWTEAGTVVSTNASYTFTAQANRTLVANFALKQYTVSVSANPTAGGGVAGGGTFNHSASVTVGATANTGYNFVNWTEAGTVVSTNASYTFTAQANRTLVANFTLIPPPPPPPPPPPVVVPPVVVPPPLPFVAEAVSPEAGGSVALPGGTIALEVPAGATATPVTFSVGQLPSDEVPEMPGTFTLAGKAVKVTVEDPDANPVREFAAPLAIGFLLTSEEVGGNWEGLVVMYYDELLGWIELPTTVDPLTGRVTATFDHLSVFAVVRVAAPAVEHGAQKVVMLIGGTRYAADHKLRRMDVAPFIENGRTFVPVRFLAEAFGAVADWTPKTGAPHLITLVRPDRAVILEIGSTSVIVQSNGTTTVIKSDVAAYVKNGRTVLPFRTIAEAFGATVDYGPKDAPVKWVSFGQ